MKHVMSIMSGEEWRAYAQRAAAYGATLRGLGLPYGHPERQRARQAIRRGIANSRHESWQHRAARRLISVISANKKALAAA